MNQDLQVHYEDSGDVVVIQAVGDVDLGTAEKLEKPLWTALTREPSPATIVLDLSEVGFLGTIGLSMLVRLEESCREQFTVLKVIAAGHAVLHPIEIAGLSDRFAIAPHWPEQQPSEN